VFFYIAIMYILTTYSSKRLPLRALSVLAAFDILSEVFLEKYNLQPTINEKPSWSVNVKTEGKSH